MFRLLRWGFYVLILLMGLGGLQFGYGWLAETEWLNLPESPIPFFRPTTGQGQVIFNGIDQVRLQPGEFLPGTDISLLNLNGEAAEFSFAQEGVRPLKPGDSVKYEGPWSQVAQTVYTYSGRVIRVSETEVVLGGFYSLEVREVDPVPGNSQINDGAVYMVLIRTADGEGIAGTSLSYIGRHADGGAHISGLESGTYDSFSVGDSLDWSGQLRPDLGVRYNLRVVFYTDAYIQLGGTVTLVRNS